MLIDCKACGAHVATNAMRAHYVACAIRQTPAAERRCSDRMRHDRGQHRAWQIKHHAQVEDAAATGRGVAYRSMAVLTRLAVNA